MDDKSKCPYCDKKMYLGVIYQDRNALKWIPEEKDRGWALKGFSKGINLTSLLETGGIESYYCKECGKIIMDVKNKTNQNI